MGLLSWLFGASSQDNETYTPRLAWEGDGTYEYDIVGESFYQDTLAAICGGKTDESREVECVATLTPEPNNPHDRNAVAVFIRGRKVGHLQRSEAAAYTKLLAKLGMSRRSIDCDALIVGGWERGKRGSGHFGVKLDISEEMRLLRE